jgi:hypothetical protein
LDAAALRGRRTTSGGVSPSWAGVRPIRNSRVPQTAQVPRVAGVPDPVNVGVGSTMVLFCLHLTQ